MSRVFSVFCPLKTGIRRYFSSSADLEYVNIATSVNEHVNRITSLWGMRNIKIKDSEYFKDDLILKLASKHLCQTEVDSLLSLSPRNKAGKLPTANSSKRIIYEENINSDITLSDNDIWLGYCKYISFFNLSLKYKSKNFKHFFKSHKNNEILMYSNGKNMESQDSSREELDLDQFQKLLDENEDLDNYTIFVFPYLRKTSKQILKSLNSNRELLSRADLRSLVYTCGSTGSSRLLRFLAIMLGENFSIPSSDSPIHKVETHAWPWMCKARDDGKELCYDLPILLDALCSCAIIRYTIGNERSIYDYIINNFKILDSKIQLLNEGGESVSDPVSLEAELERIVEYDNIILEKVLSLILIKRNIDKLGNDEIRAFSDFVCDRLHRIKPKILANIAFSLGYSKSLDEFWMFMISKQIQVIINSKLGVSSETQEPERLLADEPYVLDSDYVGVVGKTSSEFGGMVSVDEVDVEKPETKSSVDNLDSSLDRADTSTTALKVDSKKDGKDNKKDENNDGKDKSDKSNKDRNKNNKIDEFDMDDITAILDAYSNAGLEDYSFYSTICKGIENEFPSYTLHHKSVIMRSLAKVRHRDQNMLNDFMKSVKEYITDLDSSVDHLDSSLDRADTQITSTLKVDGKAKWKESVKAHMIKPIDTYIVASAIVSACDMEYKGDGMDALWKVITLKVKDSSFDICAISWLPIATITFPSVVSLTEFLPVWLKHVYFTMNKLKSRSYMMTMQRRQLLLRHAFNLGILPSTLLDPKSKEFLEELCNKNYITCKDDYIPESSTFHLEVCASLRALGVTHQREINVIPFVMDIVISPEKVFDIKSSFTSETQRASDFARSGNTVLEGDLEGFPLKYTRNSPNHRKHKEEVYTMLPKP